jgi:hypothetical protein
MGMAMRIRDLLGEDVWHGSPHHFDRFSTDHMGSGEGSQEYGWGLYFTSTRAVAEHYCTSRPMVLVEFIDWVMR